MNVAWSARWRLFGALRIILYVAMRKNPEPPKRLVGRPVGRPCGVAGPGVASLGPAREKILAKPNEHESNSPRKVHRPARGERLRFLEPERRRTGRPGARPRMGAGEKRPSTTAISSALIAIGCFFALREDSAGDARGKASCVSISLPAWCPGCSRVVEPNNLAFGDASHCCTARLKRLQLERLRALVKQL